MIVACNSGYRIYHRTTFALLSKVDDYQQLIGSLAKATLYFNSKVVIFVGSESNNSFPPFQLIVWNDDRKAKLGLLIFKEQIIDFYLGKRLLFISISNKVLIFDFPSLAYIKTVHDIASNKHQIISIKQHPHKEYQDYVLMAKVGSKNFNIINVFQYKSMSNSQKHSETKQDITIHAFDFIKLLLIDPVSNMMTVCSNYGNKIHLYKNNSAQNQFTFFTCIYLGNNIFEISNFCFDIKNKYIAFVIDSQEIILYKLNKLKQICNCKNHNDSITVKKKTNKSGFMDIINKVISGITSSYGKFDLGHKDNIVLLSFDNAIKDIIQVMNKEGQVIKIKMNRKEQGSLKKDSVTSLFNSKL